MLTTINDPPPELEEQSARNTRFFFHPLLWKCERGKSNSELENNLVKL